MTTIIDSIKNFWLNEADPRSLQMILIGSPYPIISILAIYFLSIYVSIKYKVCEKKKYFWVWATVIAYEKQQRLWHWIWNIAHNWSIKDHLLWAGSEWLWHRLSARDSWTDDEKVLFMKNVIKIDLKKFI
jgi:hypothetical protein